MMSMKKTLAVVACTIAGLFAVHAVDDVQVNYWFNVPRANAETPAEFRFGLPISGSNSEVSAMEMSLIGSASSKIDGFQWCLVGPCWTKTLNGAQLSLVNMAEKNAEDGVQVSLFNVSNRGGIQIGLANNCSDNAEFQLGLFNYDRNGWLPFMVFFNMAGDDNVAE